MDKSAFNVEIAKVYVSGVHCAYVFVKSVKLFLLFVARCPFKVALG